jgi:hypothetical protein
MPIKTQIAKLLRRAPVFFPIRFFLILTKPDKKVLEEENYNAYNPKQDIPAPFYTENEKMNVQGAITFDRALYMAKYLKGNYPGGTKSLGYSSTKILHTLQTLPEGTCGDYSQVFINFCILNDIKIREWGVHDAVYKNKKGHVFNEVFLPEENRWMCIDLHFAIYFRDKSNGQALSMADIIVKTADYKENDIEIVHFLPVKDSHEGREYIKSFYFGRDYLYFIVTHYRIKKMDTALDGGGKLPIPLIHLLLIFKGQYYKYMLVFSRKTEKEINQKLKIIFKKYKALL